MESYKYTYLTSNVANGSADLEKFLSVFLDEPSLGSTYCRIFIERAVNTSISSREYEACPKDFSNNNTFTGLSAAT